MIHHEDAAWAVPLHKALNDRRTAVFLAHGHLSEDLVRSLGDRGTGERSPWDIVTFDMKGTGLSAPVEPLLPWIVDSWLALAGRDRTRVLDRARFYSPHRKVFRSWALEGIARNPDEVLFANEGIRFEKKAWFDALARLFAILSGGSPKLFIIRGAQSASQGLINLLASLRTCVIRSPCAVVLEATGPRRWPGPASLDSWPSFLQELGGKGTLFIDGKPMSGVPSSGSARETDGSIPELPTPESMEAMRILFCAEDALARLESITDPEAPEMAALTLIRCECWAGLGDLARAGLHADEAIRTLKDPNRLIRGHLLACKIAGYRRSEGESRRSLQQAWEIAEAMKDPLATAQCRLHEVFLQDVYGITTDLLALVRECRTEAATLGLDNAISYLDSLIPVYTLLAQTKGPDFVASEVTKAIVRNRKLGNSYRPSALYHIMGYLNQKTGRNEDALRWYQSSIKLRRRLDDPIELIRAYNGIGYFCLSTSRLPEALDYFCKALSLMENMGDFVETSLTLMNMSQVYFFTGNFSESLLILGAILDVMAILGYESLPYHGKPKILALSAASAWQLGNIARTIDYRQEIRLAHVDQGSAPYVSFLDALMEFRPEPGGDYREQFERAFAVSRLEVPAAPRIRLPIPAATRFQINRLRATAQQ